MRRAFGILWVALAISLGLAVVRAVDRDGERRLQQGIALMETKGDLNGAAKVFEEVARSSDRNLAARSLLYLGQCYEKLGKTEAERAYRRIVSEFGEQQEVVTEARTRLAAIQKAQGTPGAGPSVRMIWSDPNAGFENAPSPDGRYLSFVDWDTGDLAVRDLTTGRNRRLTNKGTWQQSEEFALKSVWSPDGTRIAYDWYTPKGDAELRVIDAAGGKPKILHKPEAGAFSTEVTDWSPDGEKILVFAYPTQTRGPDWLGTVRVADGKIEKIKEVNIQQSWPARFSPDGKYILTNRETDAGTSDVILLSADGQRTMPVVDHPANDRAIGWHPGGEWVLFGSDRTGTLALWAVRVKNGQAQGEPIMTSANLPGEQPVGFTRSGALFLGRAQRPLDIFEAEIDPVTGRIISAPAKLVRRFEGVNDWPNYSQHGSQLSYVSARGTVARVQNRQDTLCILDLKTGKTRDFVTDFRQIYNPLWLSRNSGMIVAAQKRSEDIGLYRFDIETGRFTLLLEFRYGDLCHHEIAPDGKTLYYTRRNKEKDVNEFVARDLPAGTERLLHRVTPADWIRTALSPDGTQLAYLNRAEDRVIRVIPTSGGEPRDVVRYRHIGNHLVEFTWSADGKFFLVPRIENSSEDSEWSLWRFRVSDGHGERLLSNCGRPTKTTVHPDGRRIAFASPGAKSQNAELWVVEHYLPENGK